MPEHPDTRYFPAIACGEFDSPIDALLSLCVPYDEAMALVAASWTEGEGFAILAAIDVGRSVAALPLADGRWAACHAYPGHAVASRPEAERRLRKLARRGKRGLIGILAHRRESPDQPL